MAGTEAEARRRTAYWLASHGLFILLSYGTQDLLPRESLPTSITSQENALFQRQSDGGIFSAEDPLPR